MNCSHIWENDLSRAVHIIRCKDCGAILSYDTKIDIYREDVEIILDWAKMMIHESHGDQWDELNLKLYERLEEALSMWKELEKHD